MTTQIETPDTEYGEYQQATDLYHLISLPKLKGGMEKNPQWRDHTACRDTGIDFFTKRNPSVVQAKAVCAKCPVAKECLEFAITTEQKFGVWGGLTADERQMVVLT